MGLAGLHRQLDQLNLILVNEIYLLLLLSFFFFLPWEKEGCSALTLLCRTCPGCSLLDPPILCWVFFLCVAGLAMKVPHKTKRLTGMRQIRSRSNACVAEALESE